jgi:uncharacterized protein (TIGR00730 family)
MSTIKNVCVYCGSGPGTNPEFVKAATAFGKTLAENGVGLVYGGGSIGLMGAVAAGALDHGGKVTGISPTFLTKREHVLRDAQELIVTASMHERKALMAELSDGFIALPGGIGTLEELVEQLTWVQLNRHAKPVMVLNVGSFWDPLLALFDHMQTTGFVNGARPLKLLVAHNPRAVLPKLRTAVSNIAEGELHDAAAEQVMDRM